VNCLLDGVHIYYNNTSEDTTEIENCDPEMRGNTTENCILSGVHML